MCHMNNHKKAGRDDQMSKNACAWQPQLETAEQVRDKSFATGELPLEKGRYTLVWGAFCPWATPVAILLDLLHLDQVIGKSPVYALRHTGVDNDWFFGEQDSELDPLLQINRLSKSYQKTESAFTGRASVPALVDLKTGKVVNHSSAQLLSELSRQWKKFIPKDAPELFPVRLETQILQTNQQIITNLAQVSGQIEESATQEEYERLVDQYFDQLAVFEKQLEAQPYLLGRQLTLSDLLLFVQLVRFDVVYYYKNKLNKQPLSALPNLWHYARRLYHLQAFKQNTDFLAIKQHFYQGTQVVAGFSNVLPVGPDVSAWESR